MLIRILACACTALAVTMIPAGSIFADPCGMVPPIYSGQGQPITRIGELALETLLQLCDGSSVPGQRIQVPVELVPRGTTGPARLAVKA